MWVDIEQYMLNTTWQSQKHNQKGNNHGSLQEKEQLQLETVALGVDLVLSFLEQGMAYNFQGMKH